MPEPIEGMALLKFQFETDINYKAIHRCLNIAELWFIDGAGKYGIEGCLTSIQEILKIQED